MKEILKSSVGRSLHGLRKEDRIAAAWTVACGRVLAGRSAVVGFNRGVVLVEVADTTWLRQLMTMKPQLKTEIARIAGMEVSGIDFEVKRLDSSVRGKDQ